jgi:hypothetical protein
MTIGFAFLIAALVLFILAALGWPQTRVNLLAAGLACWVAAQLVGHL